MSTWAEDDGDESDHDFSENEALDDVPHEQEYDFSGEFTGGHEHYERYGPKSRPSNYRVKGEPGDDKAPYAGPGGATLLPVYSTYFRTVIANEVPKDTTVTRVNLIRLFNMVISRERRAKRSPNHFLFLSQDAYSAFFREMLPIASKWGTTLKVRDSRKVLSALHSAIDDLMAIRKREEDANRERVVNHGGAGAKVRRALLRAKATLAPKPVSEETTQEDWNWDPVRLQRAISLSDMALATFRENIRDQLPVVIYKQYRLAYSTMQPVWNEVASDLYSSAVPTCMIRLAHEALLAIEPHQNKPVSLDIGSYSRLLYLNGFKVALATAQRDSDRRTLQSQGVLWVEQILPLLIFVSLASVHNGHKSWLKGAFPKKLVVSGFTTETSKSSRSAVEKRPIAPCLDNSEWQVFTK